MPQARDQAGNIWETDAQGNAVRLVSAAGQQATVLPNPYKVSAERRADEDQVFQREQLRISQEAERRANAALAAQIANQNKPPEGFQRNPDGTLSFIPGGPADPALKSDAPKPKTDEDKASVRAEAVDKIKLARSLIERSKNGFLNTGFGAGIAGSIGGTGAYDVAQDTETLKNAGALTRIMEMAATNGGKNPLTPLSNSDFQALASSLSNLDTSQSDAQYQANVQRVIDLYERAYKAAGGTDIEAEIDPSKRRGEIPGATVNGGGSSGGTRGYENDPSGGRTFQTDVDRAYQNEAEQAFKAGASREQLDAIARKYGAPAFGPDLDQAIQARQANPNAPIGFTTPASGREEAGLTGALLGPIADSSVGSYFTGAGNAVTAGNLGNIAELTGSSQGGTDLAMQMAQENGPAYFGGEVTGGILAALGAQRGLGSLSRFLPAGAAANAVASPLAADAAYGAAVGASSADDPLYGAVGGGLLGLGGGYAGGKIGSALGGLRRPQGLSPLNAGQSQLLGAVNETGVDNVTAALLRAQDLGVPATLADVSPSVNALTGSAIRANPTLAGQARDMLGQRSAGQIDRFRNAVARDLGPLDNVPQRSDELIRRAQETASPLYEQAYAAPVVSTPDIASLLATPFGRQGLGYAEKIAANEGRNTRAMGFALDEAGNPVLNPIPQEALGVLGAAESKAFAAEQALKRAQAGQLNGQPTGNVGEAEAAYQAAKQELAQAQSLMSSQPTVGTLAEVPGYTTQTIDYAKRGMDKVLEQYRNPVTGKLVLDDLGKSENAVLRSLLNEVDRVNPAFGQARAAYAGPASEREALMLGRDALNQPTDALAIQAGRQTPERLGQMQLGARDALVQNAERLRNSSNPFDTLNSSAMEQRLSTLYPDAGDSVARLLAQRDLERQLASSANRLVGNSATAERTAADAAFGDTGAMRPIIEGGIETAISGAPAMTILRSLANSGVGQRLTQGGRRRASERAESIVPTALNENAGDTVAQILSLARNAQEYETAKALLREMGVAPGRLVGASSAAGAIPFLTGN